LGKRKKAFPPIYDFDPKNSHERLLILQRKGEGHQWPSTGEELPVLITAGPSCLSPPHPTTGSHPKRGLVKGGRPLGGKKKRGTGSFLNRDQGDSSTEERRKGGGSSTLTTKEKEKKGSGATTQSRLPRRLDGGTEGGKKKKGFDSGQAGGGKKGKHVRRLLAKREKDETRIKPRCLRGEEKKRKKGDFYQGKGGGGGITTGMSSVTKDSFQRKKRKAYGDSGKGEGKKERLGRRSETPAASL